MKTASRLAVVAAGTLAAIGWSAAPAAADHTAYINPTTQRCIAGGEATRIGTTFATTDYTVSLNKDGFIKRYQCEFTGIPEYIPAITTGRGWPEWHRPTKPTKLNVTCSTNVVQGTLGRGTFMIRPDGTGTLTCSFAPAVYYNPYCPPCSPEHPTP
jgi:hypothetical protein